MEEIIDLEIENVEFKKNTNLDRYTTIKLGGIGNIALCFSEMGLISLVEKLAQKKITYHLIGWGANQVLLNTDDTLFIKLEFPFDKEIFEKGGMEFNLPASAPLNQLSSAAIKNGFKGWEVFTGVPASLGGAICMNAGTSLGEIGSLILSVRVLKRGGNIITHTCDENSFSYRANHFLEIGDVILSAVIKHLGIDLGIKNIITEYLELRRKSQPLTTKNCGSVFKNLPGFPAGKVIESIGLKGFGTERISVSYKHGNFIENKKNADAKEFEQLIQLLEIEIERYSGFKFELEVKIY